MNHKGQLTIEKFDTPVVTMLSGNEAIFIPFELLKEQLPSLPLFPTEFVGREVLIGGAVWVIKGFDEKRLMFVAVKADTV